MDPLEEGAFCVSNGEFGFFDGRVVFVCVRAVVWLFLFFFNLVFFLSFCCSVFPFFLLFCFFAFVC